MRRSFATTTAALALSLPLVLAAAAPASAAPRPASDGGGACVQAGLATLQSLGVFQAAASKQIDYSTLTVANGGPIRATLPTGSFLSLGQVVKLHTTNPELFPWCD